MRATRRPARYGLALLLFSLAIALIFHGVVLHPGSRIPYGFGDGTSTIRDYWAAGAEHSNPFTFTHDAFDGAPEGTQRVPATLLANGGLQTVFVWGLRRILGPVGAWNAFLFLGLLGTAFAMFAFLDWLGCPPLAAFFGGYVFGFNSYILERVYAGHAGLVQNWVLVLVLWALLRLHARPGAGAALVVGGSTALAFYISAYQGLLASFAILVFLVVDLVTAPAPRKRARTVVLGATAYVATLVALIPIFALYLHERSAVQLAAGRQAVDFVSYAASISAYLLPRRATLCSTGCVACIPRISRSTPSFSGSRRGPSPLLPSGCSHIAHPGSGTRAPGGRRRSSQRCSFRLRS